VYSRAKSSSDSSRPAGGFAMRHWPSSRRSASRTRYGAVAAAAVNVPAWSTRPTHVPVNTTDVVNAPGGRTPEPRQDVAENTVSPTVGSHRSPAAVVR